MDENEKDRLLLANLEVIAYQSGELLEDRNTTLYYSDFYELYQGYLPSLRAANWTDNQCRELTEGFPQLAKPLLTKKLFVILIPSVLFLLTPFHLIVFPLYLALLAGIYYAIRSGNQRKLRQVHDISMCLIDKIRMKNSWKS